MRTSFDGLGLAERMETGLRNKRRVGQEGLAPPSPSPVQAGCGEPGLPWVRALTLPEATGHVCSYTHFAEPDPEAPKVSVTLRSEQSWDLLSLAHQGRTLPHAVSREGANKHPASRTDPNMSP